MSRALLERKLADVGGRLRALRDELRVIDEQLASLTDEADEARLRSLVSETPLAAREHRQAQRHVDAMTKRRAEVVAGIQRLESQQDELLDRLVAERG
jgi:chromosome segregation ATPase